MKIDRTQLKIVKGKNKNSDVERSIMTLPKEELYPDSKI